MVMEFLASPGGAAAITSAAGLLGMDAGRGYSAGTNKLNRKTMYRQFRLNKEMRSTAVQDRMADMRAAGINPILAGKYSADTPAASALAAIDPSSGASSVGSAAAGIASSAIQSANVTKQIEMLDAKLASEEVKEDIADFVQGVTQNLDGVATRLYSEIQTIMDWSRQQGEQFREKLNDLGQEVKSMAGSFEEKFQNIKDGAKEIIINLNQNINDGANSSFDVIGPYTP